MPELCGRTSVVWREAKSHCQAAGFSAKFKFENMVKAINTLLKVLVTQ
jgi:hypothetical protein